MMKLKILFVLIPMCILGSSAKNQVPTETPKVNVLQELKDDTRELKESTEELKKSTPTNPPKPEVVYLIKKIYVPVKDNRKVLLTLEGEEYLIDPVVHKEYFLVNADSIQKAKSDQEIERAMYSNDTFSGAIIQEANERINLWQKVKSFFKRKN
jgi:hypothetical protein